MYLNLLMSGWSQKPWNPEGISNPRGNQNPQFMRKIGLMSQERKILEIEQIHTQPP